METATPKPRLSDVALKANVSLATASLALSDHPHVNDDTKARVMEACKLLGYKPRPREKDSRRSGPRRFGFAILGTQINNETNAPILFHLAQVALAQGIRFEYAATTREMNPSRVWDNIKRFCSGLDGIMLMGLVDRELVDRLRGLKMPHVVLGNVVSRNADGSLWATCIANDDQHMGTLATHRLIGMGHKRIAFVCEFMPHGLAHHRWLQGYQLALMEAGVPVDDALIRITGKPEAGAGPAVDQLLQLSAPPTAYVVPDARIAGTLITHLRARNITLAQNALVYVGHAEMARTNGILGYPRLDPRADVMADLGVLHLERLRANPALPPVHVHVPFETADFPGQNAFPFTSR